MFSYMIVSQPIASFSFHTHQKPAERHASAIGIMLCCKILAAAIVVALVWCDASDVVLAAANPAAQILQSMSDYDNATVRYMTEDVQPLGAGQSQPLEELIGRTPRKRGHYRNNLLSFDTRNNNIEIGFEFSVPFLSVPVKRSMNTLRQTAQSVMTPLANINAGAVMLAGIMVLAGVVTSYIWRTAGNMYQPQQRRFSRQAAGRESDGGGRSPDDDDEDDGARDDRFTRMLRMLDDVLQRYDIDSRVCGQRLICSMVQNAADNVAQGFGTPADKLVDGFFGIGWVSQQMTGTPLEVALMVARSKTQRCERHFEGCRLRAMSYDLLSQQVLRFS